MDDAEFLRETLARVLKDAYGATVYEASTNREAEDILRHHEVDLILTDLIHPGENGLDLLRKLRSSRVLKRIPVIIQSGQAQEFELEAWRSGARAVLRKPYSAAKFIEIIDDVLGTVGDEVKALIELGTELPSLDYKSELRLDTRNERAAVAKDIIAFANSGGGQIVVGVEETSPGNFVPRGLTEAQAAELESSRVNRAVGRYLDPPIHVKTTRVQHLQKTFVIIDVPPAHGTLLLAATENESASLRCGRIYVRTSAAESAEVQSSDHLRDIIDRLMAAKSSGTNGA